MKTMIIKKYYILLMGLLSCSPNLDKSDFFIKSIGQYTLNQDGVDFLRLEVQIQEGDVGSIIEFKADGSLSLIVSETETMTNNLPIAQFIELKRENQGVFQLASIDQFVAMGLEGTLWLATTKAETNPDFVLFEHPVPIATKNP